AASRQTATGSGSMEDREETSRRKIHSWNDAREWMEHGQTERTRALQQPRYYASRFRCAQRTYAERRAFNIHRDARKTCNRQPPECGSWRQRHECTADMPGALQPAITNFQREERA